jgi:PAS domain S-box-containing protein
MGEGTMNSFDRGLLLHQFVDGLPDCAASLLDVDGNILTWNAGARAILGYSAGEIIGRNFSCLYTKEDVSAAVPASMLGVAQAKGLHEDNGRRVRKDGTEFETQSVLLPLYDQQRRLVGFGNLTRGVGEEIRKGAASAGPRADNIVPLRARKKILVVDDNEHVRQVALDQLTSLGYEVIVAGNGDQALDSLTRITDIALLFTDVAMPGGMGGREVAEKARQLRPGLKVLFASGYFEGALVREGVLEDGVQFIVKPYRKADLARKVEDTLGSRVASH